MDSTTEEYIRMLESINKVQSFALDPSENSVLDSFELALQVLLETTDSKYGFVGEVLKNPNGIPYLKTRAISNIAWDEASEEYFRKYKDSGLEFTNLKTLFGKTLLTGETVISNNPVNDPRAAGIPDGHPSLDAYLGIPLKLKGNMIGMIGLANRPNGYSQGLVDFLSPLVEACSLLIRKYSFANETEKSVFNNLTKLLDEEISVVRRRSYKS
jgi:GAF domain-containing protein